MNKLIYTCIFGCLFLLASSCEDPIELESDFENSQLVIDAWLNNSATAQFITLTESQDYFDNRLPTPITGAEVTVSSDENIFEFIDIGNGQYEWNSDVGLGNVGDEFTLKVIRGNDVYTASTKINRVPEIDSISIYFEEAQFGNDAGIFCRSLRKRFCW